MKLNYREFDEFCQAITLILKRYDLKSLISIEPITSTSDTDETTGLTEVIEFGINWSSFDFGAIPVASVERFIERLQLAIDITNVINGFSVQIAMVRAEKEWDCNKFVNLILKKLDEESII